MNGRDYRTIPLTRGEVSLVSPEDFEGLARFKWYADICRGGRQKYAVRGTAKTETGHRQRKVRMHRQILCAPPGLQVDHINGDTLDNRRANLRLCSNAENARNQRRPFGKKSSVFKGVCWNREHGRWVAYIKVDGRKIHLGYFDFETGAALAYDGAAQEYFGEFARVNLPDERRPA